MIIFIFFEILLLSFFPSTANSTNLSIKETPSKIAYQASEKASSVKKTSIDTQEDTSDKKALSVEKESTLEQNTSDIERKSTDAKKAFLIEEKPIFEQNVSDVEKESAKENKTSTAKKEEEAENPSAIEEEVNEQNTSSSNQDNLSEMKPNEDIKSNLESFLTDVKKNEYITVSWKTAFKGKTFMSRLRTDFVAIAENYIKFNWQVTDFLSVYNEGLIMGRNGFSQSVYERSDRRSGFHLIESYFDMKISPLALKFGIVKQDFLKAPLLITDKPFTSLIQQLSFDLGNKAKLALVFQEAITNNAMEFIRKEPNLNKWPPLFLTSSLFLDLKDILSLNIKEKLTAFHYRNLSSSVAYASKFYGNNTNKGSESDSQFEYDFLGLYNSLKLQKTLSKNWMIEVGGDFIHNFFAPETYNQGGKLQGSIYHNYKDFTELNFSAEYFFNQPDSSVAYFNSELYGHNDREGVRFVLQSHFYSSGLTFGLSYVESRTIKGSPDHSYAVTVFLKSNYVSI